MNKDFEIYWETLCLWLKCTFKNAKKLNLKCFPENHCVSVHGNYFDLMTQIYTSVHHIVPILHIFTTSIKMKYDLNNNWHHCEPEIDVNSALICCLVPQHFTRGNSTCDLHIKLWSNEHGLSWIIPWFLPSKDKFCLQWPETHPLSPGGSIILLSHLAVYHSSWNNQFLFAIPLTVCNSDNGLRQVVNSHWSCHTHCALVEASLSFLILQPIVYPETARSLFTAPLTVYYSYNRLWSSRWTCQANRNSKGLEASYSNFI